MKRLLPALLAAFAASAPAQLPGGPAPSPSTTSGPATVTAKTEAEGMLTISLDQGRTVLSHGGNLAPVVRKAFRVLQVGRSYTFPEAFYTPADDSADFVQTPFQGLENRAPFRALVDRVEVTADRVSLRLCCADGGQIEYLHTGTQDIEKIKALIAPLVPEETYEFPAVLQGKQPPPPPAGAEPLDQYVGEWRGTLDGDPAFFITMRCAWRADGQGLWREIMYDDSTSADPIHDIAVITADKDGRKFVASDPREPNKLPATSTYDAASKTFTSRLPAFQVGVIRSNTATFTDPDTITWKTLSRTDAGAVLSNTSGSYHRVTKKLSPALATMPSFPASNITPIRTEPPPPNELLKLDSLPPFRATVLKREIGEDSASIRLEFRMLTYEPVVVTHNGKEGWDKALKLAQRLEEGSTYEFPDVLKDDYVPTIASIQPQPATEEMRALQGFIGSWKDPGHPDKSNLNRLFWKEDGSGLWREITTTPPTPAPPPSGLVFTMPQDTDAPQPRITHSLITYDAQRRCYVETPSVDVIHSVVIKNGVKTVTNTMSPPSRSWKDYEAHWDAAKQTYTWSQLMDAPQAGTKISGVRHFVSPDRIDWTSQVTTPDGKVTQENAGHYERVAP